MNPADPEALQHALDTYDIKAVANCFQGRSEQERRALFKAVSQPMFEKEGHLHDWEIVAFAAGATRSETEKVNFWLFGDQPHAWQALEDRRPEWLQEYADRLIKIHPRGRTRIERAVKRGLVKPPQHENWTLGAIESFTYQLLDTPLADRLRMDPEYLSGELWRLFEIEGISDCSLANYDKYCGSRPQSSWLTALVTLADEGHLSRKRLLAASLEALSRDFPQFKAGWYSRFHKALKPQHSEIQQLKPQYLLLLGSTIAPTVTFALDHLLKLSKAGDVTHEDLLRNLTPAFSARAKGTVSKALRMAKAHVESATGGDPSLPLMCAEALHHEHADVQEAALKLLWPFHDHQAVRDAVNRARDCIAPSLLPELSKWGLESAGVEVPRNELPAPHEPEPVKSIEDLSGFLLALAALLEDATDAIEVERVLAAWPRFFDESPPDALAKRAVTLCERYIENDPIRSNLVRAVIAWHERTELEPHPYPLPEHYGMTTHEFFVARLQGLFASREARRVLLATPTDHHGWVDPERLVARALERAKSQVGTEDRADEIGALLRLGFWARDSALASCPTRGAVDDSPFWAALRHALGSPHEVVGDHRGLWWAAARARDPHTADTKVLSRFSQGIRGGAGPAHSRLTSHRGEEFVWRTLELDGPKGDIDAALEPVAVLQDLVGERGTPTFWYRGHRAGVSAGHVRWSGILAPGCSEDYFTTAVIRIDEDQTEAQWEVVHFFEPLFRSTTTWGPNAVRLVALGLSAITAGHAGAAIEALLTGIAGGKLTAVELGTVLGQLLTLELARCGRWAKHLGEVARVSPDAARFVHTTLEHMLAIELTKPPRDLLKPLDLLHEISLSQGMSITNLTARQFLESISVGGKTGRLKALLLALPGN